jgi:hypothetical protein
MQTSLLKSFACFGLLLSLGIGCSGGLGDSDFPPMAKRWYDRALKSYLGGDLEDAGISVENALRVAPNQPETRLLAGRISLAALDYDRSLEVLKGIDSLEARGLRGRSLWYKGDVQLAADELEALVADPDVRDPWAVEIIKLARRGQGRKPFEMRGGMVAVSEMPRTGTPSMIVPLEINGDPALGMIATGTAEAVVDSATGAEPSWVSLRFGERIEVRDVPALAKDLSGISRQVNAPIKILLGVNLLRHLRPTIDFAGSQFIVRNYDPPAPPAATTLRLSYVKGGGMLLRGSLGTGDSAPSASLLIDTALTYPVALDDGGWQKAGIAPSSLQSVPSGGSLKQGVVPSLRLGAFEVPRVPGLQGEAAVKEREDGLGVEIDGLVGAGLLATFRVTLFDGGRSMWLEDMPHEAMSMAPLNIPPVEDIPIEEYERMIAEEEAEEAAASGKAPKAAPAKPKGAAKP